MEYTYSGSVPLGNGKKPTKFGYDAIESSTRRRSPRTTTRSEDRVMDRPKRRKMAATVRDTIRNFNIVSWMCRKHLDYVTTFSFKATTENPEFNKALEKYVDDVSTRHRFHSARRHPLRRFLRISEGRRVLDGDFGIMRFMGQPGSNIRGKVQGIESDLIDDPDEKNITEKDNERWVNGVFLSKSNAALKYGVWRRSGDKREYDRKVSARDFYLHAYFDSTFRNDQVRGISPFAASLNTLVDTREILGYAKAKHKVAQMFGLVLKREDTGGPINPSETDTDGDDIVDQINFNEGPQIIDLSTEESAEFLENKTGATETVDLLRFLMQMAILCLDFPVSMLDERETTFFGGRGALMQYLKSATTKIEDNRDFLNWFIKWRIGLAVVDGDLVLPRSMPFEDISWEWVSAGVPWWDPSKEATGYGMAVGASFTTFNDVIKELYGGRHNVEDNLRENAKVYALAKELEVPLVLPGVAAAALPDEPEPGPVDEPTDEANEGVDDDDDSDTENGA